MADQKKRSGRGLNMFFAGLFVLIGGLILAITIGVQNQRQATLSWPSTEGAVVVSFPEAYVDSDQKTLS